METREILLSEEHTHEGKKYYPGQTVVLPAEEAEWLCNTVVAKRVETAKVAENLPGTTENAQKITSRREVASKK